MQEYGVLADYDVEIDDGYADYLADLAIEEERDRYRVERNQRQARAWRTRRTRETLAANRNRGRCHSRHAARRGLGARASAGTGQRRQSRAASRGGDSGDGSGDTDGPGDGPGPTSPPALHLVGVERHHAGWSVAA